MRSGFDLECVLEQMTMSVFKETILIVTRQNVIQLQQLGLTIMTSLGAILSKEGGKQAQDIVQQQVSRIDSLLYPDAPDEDETEEAEEERLYEPQRPVRKGKNRKAPKPSQKKVMQMLGNFHGPFAKLTGAPIPSLNSAINAALREQSKNRIAEK